MAVILAAKRSAVVPRGGAFARLEVEDMAAPVVRALLDAAGMSGDAVDELICANALGAGGNPARIVALAGSPGSRPATTPGTLSYTSTADRSPLACISDWVTTSTAAGVSLSDRPRRLPISLG